MKTASQIEPGIEPGLQLPRINLLTMFRLGLFQMCLGTMSLLTLGVLNRIMIDELKVFPLVAAIAIAMHQFVSPARIWFGQLSDSKVLLGHHRSGYIWLGAALFTTLAFIALQTIWQLGSSLQNAGWSPVTWTWAVLLGLVFACYGLALSASSTPFAALLIDVSDDDQRSKVIGIVWSMLMVGIVLGAILSSRLLNTPEICGAAIVDYNPLLNDSTVVDLAKLRSTVTPVFITVPATAFGLCLVATWGIEKKYSRYQFRSSLAQRDDQITLGTALKVLTASRQTGLFFSFLLVLTVSLFMQDPILEPYGGEVFGMCIAETTQLNVPFGIGTLVGISSTGFLVLPRLGKQRTTNLGCIGAAIAAGLITLSGFAQNAELLKISLLIFGLSAGILTAGATNLMLDFTAAETAGTFIGAWGLAQAMARGLSTVIGGAVLNLGKLIFTSPIFAYSLVFALEAIGLITAIFLLRRVSIQEFRNTAKEAILQAIGGDLD